MTDEQIEAALAVPLRMVDLGEEMVLVIGADAAGRILEIVVAGYGAPRQRVIHAMPLRPKSTATCEVTTMTNPRAPHLRDEAEAERAEALLDALDPEVAPAQDPVDLRRIGLAVRGIEEAKAALEAAIAAARAAGRSWTEIGTVLGVSRQAARERFSERASA